MNLHRWFKDHSLRLLAIRDTPNAIAGGAAIGIFFGFTPLFGLKIALTILFAWLTRSNIIAAVIASAAHDILLPLMPVIMRWEYEVGFWLLSHPHRLPPSLTMMKWEGISLRRWIVFLLGVGKPMLVGGFVCAAPFAVLSYAFTRRLVVRHRQKRHAQELLDPANPS